MVNQPNNSEICIKLTNYYIEIQKYLDITPTYSIAESRKSLEYICKSIFELENLEIPVNNKGYSSIASLIYHLNKEKIIDQTTHSTMQVIRCHGNKASHDSDDDIIRDDAYLVHQHLSRLIIWFTEKYGISNCKVHILAINQRNTFTKRKKNSSTLKLMELAEKFIKLSEKLGQSKKYEIYKIINELRTDRYVREILKGLMILPFIGAAFGVPLGVIATPLAVKKIDKNTIDDLRNYFEVKYDFIGK